MISMDKFYDFVSTAAKMKGNLFASLTLSTIVFTIGVFRYFSTNLLLNNTTTTKQLSHITKRFNLYTNPICPFANRVWITISELQVLDKFSFIPIPLTYEVSRGKSVGKLPAWASGIGIIDGAELEKLKNWYVENVSKSGEVPILFDHFSSYPNEPYKESEIICEYLCLILGGNSLFPTSQGLQQTIYFPDDVVRFRLVLKQFQVSTFYACLKNQMPELDAQLFKELRGSLGKFVNLMNQREGPYFFGKNLSYIDIHFIPFVYRFSNLLKHYRKMDIFKDCEEINQTRFKAWFSALMARPQILKTLPKLEDIIDYYESEAHAGKTNEQGFFVGRGISNDFGK